VRAHEKTVTDGGLTADQVKDAVRIAATIYATAVALEAGETAEGTADADIGRSRVEERRGPSRPAQRSGRDGSDSCTRRRVRAASSIARLAWVSASSGK
jgi:hypothetical protein